MSVGNGKDTDTTTLPEAIEEHGGHWHNSIDGASVIQMQLAQVQAAREAQAKLVQLEVQRRLTIANLKAEADSAQADFVAAMTSSDYEQVAKAARRMTRAETALVNLGAYDNG